MGNHYYKYMSKTFFLLEGFGNLFEPLSGFLILDTQRKMIFINTALGSTKHYVDF